jgi:hypothetical protein
MNDVIKGGAFLLVDNLKDAKCKSCPWLEWDGRRQACLNRKNMVCSLYLAEIFDHAPALDRKNF